MEPTASVITKLIEHARIRPTAPALIWCGKETSYAELCDMMWGAYSEVRELSSGPLGILARKSPRAIGLLLGAMLDRRSFLVPSPGLPESTLRGLFTQARCTHVVSPDDNWDAARESMVAQVMRVEPGSPDSAAAPVGPDDPDQVSFMLTTSGSTGLPKIVPLTVGAVDRFADWAHDRFDLGPGRSVLNYAPLNFDLCLLDIWATLKQGGCVVLVDPDQATNARSLFDLLADHPVDVIQAVPMLYGLLTDAARQTGEQVYATQHVIFTGDAIQPGCLAELPKLFPEANFYNLYGCTETNDSFIHRVDVESERLSPLPLGEPLPGVEALLVTDDGGVLTGAGTGELYVTTPFQTTGYLNASLDDKFVEHPERPDGRRYFRSGDLVRRHPDGRLTLEGRNDFQVKIRGQRVNTQEVEQALLAHGQVLEAAVVAIPDPRAGHRLHAALRRRPDSGLNSLEIRRHCAGRLPGAGIPSTVQIVDGPLPRTSTGKIDRNHIKSSQTEAA
ncbi:AMP-binding protein [Streptosporangium sp. NPDC003464]